MIYEYRIKQIHGIEYRDPCDTFNSWEDALEELGYDREEIETLSLNQVQEEVRRLGAPSQYDDIYPNQDFINLMLKDWPKISFELHCMDKIDSHELEKFMIAFEEEISILMKNFILNGKICDWSTRTWYKCKSWNDTTCLLDELPSLAELNR